MAVCETCKEDSEGLIRILNEVRKERNQLERERDEAMAGRDKSKKELKKVCGLVADAALILGRIAS